MPGSCACLKTLLLMQVRALRLARLSLLSFWRRSWSLNQEPPSHRLKKEWRVLKKRDTWRWTVWRRALLRATSKRLRERTRSDPETRKNERHAKQKSRGRWHALKRERQLNWKWRWDVSKSTTLDWRPSMPGTKDVSREKRWCCVPRLKSDWEGASKPELSWWVSGLRN